MDTRAAVSAALCVPARFGASSAATTDDTDKDIVNAQSVAVASPALVGIDLRRRRLRIGERVTPAMSGLTRADRAAGMATSKNTSTR